MDKQHAAELLKTIPLFSDLDQTELIDVLRVSHLVQFSPGESICRQGERGDSLYIIEAGKAEVSIDTGGGRRLSVATLESGEVFGELTLIDDEPRSADVTVTDAVEGYRIDRKEFQALRDELNPAAYKVLRQIALTVCQRLRAVNDHVSERSENLPPRRFMSMPAMRLPHEEARSFWRGMMRWIGRGGA